MLSLDSLDPQCPSCTECKATDSTFWHRNDAGDVVCSSCYVGRRDGGGRPRRNLAALSSDVGPLNKTNTDEVGGSEGGSGSGKTSSSGGTSVARRSSRLKPPTKMKNWQNTAKPLSTKGRSRRIMFKKNPVKAPVSVATVVTSEYIFFEGSYWQVGDVVAVVDVDDRQTYYAQLRGFLQDQYCNKSAVITWLVPKPSLSLDAVQQTRTDFDSSLYVAGPEEDLPRDMSHFEFVCHAPSDYFKRQSAYQSYMTISPPVGCVWTSLGPEIQSLGTVDGDHLSDTDVDSSRTKASNNQKGEAGKKIVLGKERRLHKAGISRTRDRLAK